jgi:hypothetical protein
LYFRLILILVLFSCLGIFALKSATKKSRLFLFVSAISLSSISILVIISHHYKEMNPSALILLLIITFVLVMWFKVRRLR